MKSIALLFLITAAVAFEACQDRVVEPSADATILTIDPADAAYDVALTSTVQLTFSGRMDAAKVARGVRLISSKSLADSSCPDSIWMQHGSMTTMMNGRSMMDHLASQHAVPGTLTWSADSLTCLFTPDSMLTPKTDYMVYLNGEMTQMMSDRLGDMGMIGMGGMSGLSGRAFHFTTRDTTSAGGGHNGHH